MEVDVLPGQWRDAIQDGDDGRILLATHLIKEAGFSCTTAHTGAVTLIQRFGSALNLNLHFHMLFLDGVYFDSANRSSPRFRWVKAPTSAELIHLTHTIAQRVGRFLERQGLLERDAENSYLTVMPWKAVRWTNS